MKLLKWLNISVLILIGAVFTIGPTNLSLNIFAENASEICVEEVEELEEEEQLRSSFSDSEDIVGGDGDGCDEFQLDLISASKVLHVYNNPCTSTNLKDVAQFHAIKQIDFYLLYCSLKIDFC